MPPQKAMQLYEAAMYDFCDALDSIARQKGTGPSWAAHLASQAVASAAAFFPRAVQTVLDDDEIVHHKEVAERWPVRFKADAPGMVTVQMTRDEADAWQAAIANEGNAKIVALLRQVAGQRIAVTGAGKLTDSGLQSKPATKANPPTLKDMINDALDHVAREGIH